MKILRCEESAAGKLCDLRFTEHEVMVYQGCIEHVLKTCSPEEIAMLTGCTREELKTYSDRLRNSIQAHIEPVFRIKRLKPGEGQE